MNSNVRQEKMSENDISGIIVGAALKVHRSLGPGLLESAYEECLFYELNKTGIMVERQKPMPLIYEEIKAASHELDFEKVGRMVSYLIEHGEALK